jgi:hypothetical protein
MLFEFEEKMDKTERLDYLGRPCMLKSHRTAVEVRHASHVVFPFRDHLTCASNIPPKCRIQLPVCDLPHFTFKLLDPRLKHELLIPQ